GGQAYTVTITDAAGCELVETIAVDNPKEVVASIESATDVSCAEGSDGTATAIASGGVEPYSYSWGANTGSQNTPTASGLAEGTYFVTVADANGCQAVVSTTIDQPEPLGVGFVSEKVDCFGASTGSLSAQAEGGTAPYTYVWSTGQQGKVIDALAAGTYTVTIFDANGCELIETSEVFQPEAPLAALFEADDVSCFGREDGVIYLDPSGGTPPYTFSIDGEHFVGTTQLVGLEAGEYNVWMRDSRGCEYITSEILILEPEPLSVDLGPDLRIDMGETAVLDAEVSAPVVSYEWIPLGPEGLNCYDCFDPETDALFNPATYELVVTDENGCTAEDRINVFVHKDRLVLVPPAFSPNSDSHNDRLLVHGKSGTTVTLFQVYDRWGELVFEAGDFPVNDPNIGWDGSFKGELMNSGVFIWYVEVRYVDGVEETFKGSTTLIR
ncbi:MAG: gliding motility-associated C-terminal domain-containing protein, partial [Saprospiraceae bacterium]|nr:gliding motility-associated C-terminal domain-containing protein [Saprospiraceae bacterium]